MSYQAHPERGNVLFLILIAVALFAALSYAVTSSTRSGGADASAEKIQLNLSRYQAYVSGLRNTILRMSVGGTPLAEINFYPPSDFSTLSAAQQRTNVFHPQGGSYPYDSFLDVETGTLVKYILAMQVEGVGTDSSDASGNDITIAIPVSDAMCDFVNRKLVQYTGPIPNTAYVDNSSGPYSLAENGPTYTAKSVTDYGFPVNFRGKPEGCGLDAAIGSNFYYATLVER